MLIVQDKKSLMNRFRVLVNRGTEIKLFRDVPSAITVTHHTFKGNRVLVNVWMNIVKTMEAAKKTKKKDDYASWLMTFKPKAMDRLSEAAGAFLESVAIKSLAMNKEAVEAGFERIFDQRATVVVPDKFWQETAQDATGAIKRFDGYFGSIIDSSIVEDQVVSSSHKSLVRRMADEAFSSQSKSAMRVQGYAGAESYVWSTRRDLRVVGNPVGIYPVGNEAHGDHWSREGRTFLWSEAPDGDGAHPGQAPGCRCIALPKLSLNSTELR